MVETPTATAYKAVEEEAVEVDAPLLSEDQKDEKKQLKALEQDLFLVKQAPITRKIRTAVKHIVAVAGPLARFRGLHVAILYSAIQSFLVNFIAPNHGSWERPLVAVIATIGLCRVKMLWTHIVISNPSQKTWYKRWPSVAAGKNVIVPTAVYAIARQAAVYIPLALATAVADNVKKPEVYGVDRQTMQKIAAFQGLGVVALFLVSVLLIVIPAEVTLTRVSASMLPEEDESIVPFDRSFGGKVVPTILGGTGSVGMLDAWKTFDKEARTRLIKLYFKIFAIQTATAIFFVLTLVGELRLIMGKQFDTVIAFGYHNLKHGGNAQAVEFTQDA